MSNPNGVGGFTKGHKKGIGRPKGSKNLFNSDTRKAIMRALGIVEKDLKVSGGKTFWEHVAIRSFKSDQVLIALLKKFVPDLQATQLDLGKGTIKRVKFEIIEGDQKPDSESMSTKKTLEELEG